MKILIIRFSSIGDIVLTTPVVRCIKQQLPDVELHYLTKFSFHQVIASNPYIDRFFYLQDNWDILMHELKEQEYDFIIDLHHNLRTARIKRALKVNAASFPKLNVEKWLYVHFKINFLPSKHIVDRYFETAKLWGIKNDGRGLDYFIPETEVVQPKDLPYAHSAGFIAVVIGAAHATKRMPVDLLTKLCQRIQHPLVLLGGSDDRKAGEEITSADPIKIYNACGKFSLNESADIIRQSKLVITHDTGLMHMAAAFKKSIISIWGNTVPAFGMTPYYGNQSVPTVAFEVNGLNCRPCSKIGHEACPKKHFKCMRHQDIEAIAQLAEEWAASKRIRI
jgi:heptosyltransferase-2